MALLTLGEKLKKERTSKGISLQEISSATRINMEFLRGLERDDYSNFPAKVFVTGFLRSYAKHLSVDPDKIIDEYEQVEEEKIESEQITDYSDTKFEKFGVVVMIPLLLVCLIAYVIYLNMGGEDKKELSVASQTQIEEQKESEVKDEGMDNLDAPAEEETALRDEITPLGGKGLVATEKSVVIDTPKIKVAKKKEKPAPVESAKEKPTVYKYRVELSAGSEDVWVFADIDGNNTRDLFVRAGNAIRFRGNKSFTLTIGNPKHLKISLNGKEVKMNIPPSGVLRKWELPLE